METGINLLPQLTDKEIKAGVYRRKSIIASLATLGAVGLIILAILGYQIYLSVRAEDIKNKTEKARQDVIEKADIEIANKALVEKVDKIDQILTTQIPSSTLVDQIVQASNNSIAPVKITGISVVKTGEVDIEGVAVGAKSFEDWITNLTSENGKDYFTKINLVSMNGEPVQGYKFVFRLSFIKKGVYQSE